MKSDFELKNNVEREKFVRFFARKLKSNPNLKDEQIIFVNQQILNSRNFYDRLLKTKGGYEKIVKRFNIGNKNILRRLKRDSKNNDIKLIERENDSFVYL